MKKQERKNTKKGNPKKRRTTPIKPKVDGGGVDGPDKKINFYWIYAVVGVVLLGMIMLNSDGGGKEIQFSDFKTYVEEGEVDHVTHDGHVYKVYLTERASEELSMMMITQIQ